MNGSAVQIAAMIGLGLAAGLFGGLLGIGGSVVMIPGMTALLDPSAMSQHLFQAAAMIVNFCIAAPAARRHALSGAVVPRVVKRTIPAAIVGVLAGVLTSDLPFFRQRGQVWLAGLFGLFLLYVIGINVRRLFVRKGRDAMDDAAAARLSTLRILLGVGLPSGFVAGLLGVGGGIIAIPTQQLFLRMPLRQAIANSSCTIAGMALIGAATKNATLLSVHHTPVSHSLLLAAMLIPLAILGANLGARLTHILPRQLVRVALLGVLGYGCYVQLARPVRHVLASPPPLENPHSAFRIPQRLCPGAAPGSAIPPPLAPSPPVRYPGPMPVPAVCASRPSPAPREPPRGHACPSRP